MVITFVCRFILNGFTILKYIFGKFSTVVYNEDLSGILQSSVDLFRIVEILASRGHDRLKAHD